MRTASRWLAIGNVVLALAMAMTARTRPHYGGTLRIELREPNWQDNDAVRALVLETLTTTSASGEAQPCLATRWEQDNGGRRWTFTLRTGVVWHDGTPLTPETVVAALRAGSGGLPAQSAIRANGETVVVESARPIANLPATLALSRFALARTVEHTVVGTGAFRLANIAGSQATLAANDAYWGGRPYIDSVEIGTGRAVRDQWMDAGVGRSDVAEVPAEMLRRAQQERLHPVLSPNTELIVLVSTRNGSSLDARLRQALAATVDRAALLNFAFQKQGEVAPGLLPNRISGYAALFSSTPDSARARELRNKAGQSRALTIGYDAADATLQLVAERIALNARDAGLQAVAAASGEADFVVERTPLPSTNLAIAMERFAAAVDTPLAAEPNEIEDIFREERELLTEANLIPLLYVPRAYAIAERISGAAIDDTGRLELAGAWIEEPR